MPWPESSAAMASGCFMETVYLSSASYFIPACSAAICSTRACIEVLTDGRPILVPGPMSLSDLIFGSRNTRTRHRGEIGHPVDANGRLGRRPERRQRPRAMRAEVDAAGRAEEQPSELQALMRHTS